MKKLSILFAILIIGCNGNRKTETVIETDTLSVKPVEIIEPEKEIPVPTAKVYANQRFKDITVEQTGVHIFTITGKAQVFEATFSWVVEDGHNQLKKGFVTTDAGAPEWGNFKFTVDVEKKRENSTLNLIIFEASAKDGSPQFELPIVLY